MRPEPPSRALGIGVIVSIALHLGAAAALVAEAHWRAEHPDHPPRPLSRLPEQQDHKITLGETTSNAVSMTWIGYDQFKEQFAEKSEVEQAALQRDPAAGGRPIPALPAPNPAALAQAVAEPAAELAEKVIRAVEALPEPVAVPEPTVAAAPEPPTDAEPAAAERPVAQPQREPTPVAEAPPAEPEPPRENPTGGEGNATGQASGVATAEGAESDRESDASSVVDAPVKKLGQPLAARGLRITSVKPRLSHRTQIMGGRRDPVVRLHFASDGRVRSVEFLQESGNVDIDRPVEDALFFWKAEGEALASLGDPDTGDTLSVVVRILR